MRRHRAFGDDDRQTLLCHAGRAPVSSHSSPSPEAVASARRLLQLRRSRVAPAPPTCIRVSSAFRYATASHGEHVFFVSLSGHWLEKYRFNIEEDVHIEAEHGRPTLTNDPTHMAKVW